MLLSQKAKMMTLLLSTLYSLVRYTKANKFHFLLNSAQDHSIEINSFRVNKSYYELALRVCFDDP